MPRVTTSAAGVVSTGVDDLLFSGAGSIVTTLVKLAAELYTSREMCEDLISSVKGLQAPLANMLASGHATRQGRTGNQALVDEETHQRPSRRARTHRGDLTSCLHGRIGRETHAAHRHGRGIAKTNERVEQQHLQYLAGLQQSIDDISSTSLADTRLVDVALADFKHEIKSKASEYSESELEQMKQLFLAGCESYNIPPKDRSLPVWYTPRSDVRFDRANPFATGEFHGLHYGTLDSGARVAVNIVNAQPEDTKVRERFVRKVDSLNLLRDLHILPFLAPNTRMHRSSLFGRRARTCVLAQPQSHRRQSQVQQSSSAGRWHRRGVGFHVCICACELGAESKTKPTTYEWTAPECLGVGKDANPRFESDVYSLGMCVIEAATGQRPFHGVTDNEEAIRDRIHDGRFPDWTSPDGEKISPEVTALVTTMCSREYAHRAKLNQIIHTLAVLAAQECVMREAAVSTCESAACGRCGNGESEPHGSAARSPSAE